MCWKREEIDNTTFRKDAVTQCRLLKLHSPCSLRLCAIAYAAKECFIFSCILAVQAIVQLNNVFIFSCIFESICKIIPWDNPS